MTCLPKYYLRPPVTGGEPGAGVPLVPPYLARRLGIADGEGGVTGLAPGDRFLLTDPIREFVRARFPGADLARFLGGLDSQGNEHRPPRGMISGAALTGATDEFVVAQLRDGGVVP